MTEVSVSVLEVVTVVLGATGVTGVAGVAGQLLQSTGHFSRASLLVVTSSNVQNDANPGWLQGNVGSETPSHVAVVVVMVVAEHSPHSALHFWR